MGIATIIGLILPLLSQLLGSEGVISPNLAGLIGKLAGAIPSLVASLISGKGSVTSEILAILQAIQQEVDALKTSGVLLTLNQANEINALDAAITDAINAYNESLKTTDPSNLGPLPENLG